MKRPPIRPGQTWRARDPHRMVRRVIVVRSPLVDVPTWLVSVTTPLGRRLPIRVDTLRAEYALESEAPCE